MADDPTTTGPKVTATRPADVTPEEWQNLIEQATRDAQAQGADTSQAEIVAGRGYHFELRGFTGQFQIFPSERVLMFQIIIAPPGGFEQASEANPPIAHAFHFPRSLVGDVNPEDVFKIVINNFHKHVWRHFAVEAVHLFTDLVNFSLLDLNPGLSGPASRDRIIKNHVSRTEGELRGFFEIKPPRRGRGSPWTMLELSKAVQKAAGEVSEPVTASKVAQRMKKLYPDKAPGKGKALLKLIERHGLKWADLVSSGDTKPGEVAT